MKKLLTLVGGLLLLSHVATAQSHFHFGIGYNLGFAKYDSLNYVIDRYNETRNFLDKEMDHITFPNGFAFSLGGSTNNVIYDFAWIGKHQTVGAEGIDGTGVLTHRDLKFRWNTFNIGLGFGGGRSSRIGAGFSVDVGYLKMFTRVGPADEVSSMDYSLVKKELLLGSSVFLHLLVAASDRVGFILKPYYQFPYWRVDMINVNSSINTKTYINDPGLQKAKFSSFGVTIQLALMFGN